MFITMTQQAIAEIEARGLNRIRCSLTGAPYATVDNEEIALSLDGDILSNPNVTVERLVDNWEIRAITLNSRPSPALRGLKEKSLIPFLQGGHHGRLMTYLLTRLLYPAANQESLTVDFMRERMIFAIECYESVKTWDPNAVHDIVQQLLAIDSYCAMPYWHHIWVFNSPLSRMGMRNSMAGESVRALFLQPTPDFTVESIRNLLDYMFKLMLYAAEIDSNAGYSGNKFASAALTLSVDAPPVPHIPHFQKSLSQADLDRIEMQKKIANKESLKIAHSAIHGKGVLPGGSVGQSTRTPASKSDRLWNMIAENKGEAKAKKKLPTQKVPSKNAKPVSAFDKLFAAAAAKMNLKI